MKIPFVIILKLLPSPEFHNDVFSCEVKSLIDYLWLTIVHLFYVAFFKKLSKCLILVRIFFTYLYIPETIGFL